MPFLDHRVFEFAWGLPLEMKVGRSNCSKKILRELLKRYLPNNLVDRLKWVLDTASGLAQRSIK